MAARQDNGKILGLLDIIIMSIVANFGIRWLAVAAGIGPSSILFWFLGAVLFFFPLAIIAAQMSKLYPEEGGIYSWSRHALGEKHGFMVAWLYWVNNIFYYPAVLIFLVTNFAFAIGMPSLANNQWYITIGVLIAFWTLVAISLMGLKANKFLVNYGGVLGSLIPAALLILFAIASLIIFKHSATAFNVTTLKPSHKIFSNLSTLSIIMFAMAGIEIIPTFANSVKNPKRDLFLGLLIGAISIFLLYTVGTVAMNIIATPSDIEKASGLMQTFSIIDAKFHIDWFTQVVGFLLTFAELAAVSVWLIAPIIMFFKCTPEGILPAWLHTTNKHGAPQNAIFFLGAIVSGIVLLTTLLPNINVMYQVLVLMATILYFIPYLYLAVVFIKTKQKLPLANSIVTLLGCCVLFATGLGIVFSFPPPASMHKPMQIFLYEAELIIGPLVFILLGALLYRSRKA